MFYFFVCWIIDWWLRILNKALLTLTASQVTSTSFLIIQPLRQQVPPYTNTRSLSYFPRASPLLRCRGQLQGRIEGGASHWCIFFQSWDSWDFCGSLNLLQFSLGFLSRSLLCHQFIHQTLLLSCCLIDLGSQWMLDSLQMSQIGSALLYEIL